MSKNPETAKSINIPKSCKDGLEPPSIRAQMVQSPANSTSGICLVNNSKASPTAINKTSLADENFTQILESPYFLDDTDDLDEYSLSLSIPREDTVQEDYSSNDEGNTSTPNTIEQAATNASSIEPSKLELLAGFKIGFAEDKNKRYRRTMEDAHSFFYNFNKVIGQGWFGIFDGHAGKTAAEWCGSNLHENFISILGKNPDLPIPEILHKTFLFTDVQLGEKKGLFSGCTVAVAFLRREHREDELGTKSSKRVLYTANVGDARIVLSRNNVATRLSYDHKGSDSNEAHRILDAGGFVMNNRVNGVLAVTRSLGDVTMKEWIIGDPYTTETELNEKDDFMILACDGLWDVCTDQAAVDLVKEIMDPQQASDKLLEYALTKCSTDNLSVMVVRFEEL